MGVKAVPSSTLDPTHAEALNVAIKATWEAAHKATQGDVAMLMPVLAELMSRVVAALYSDGMHPDLEGLTGHLYSRAQQIIASHDGPLTQQVKVN